MNKVFLAVGFAVMLAFVATPAQALTVQFTSDHCTGGCGTAPFGEVVLTQNGSDVDFVVSLFDGSGFVRTGAGNFNNFEFNGVGVALADIDTSGSSPALTAVQGAFSGGGGGNYQFGVFFTGQANGGGAGISNDIKFTVDNATIADVTHLNNLNQIFVADIISGQTGLTGLVDVSSVPASVPEPAATLLLLGLGGVGVAGLRKKF